MSDPFNSQAEAASAQATTTPNAAPALGERELCISIRTIGLDYWEYQGTRAQLEAEGVIPPTTEWPEGAKSQCWEDCRLSWRLQRTRPAGMKGPMKLWTSGDWWSLYCCQPLLPDRCNTGPGRHIADMKRALAKELHRQSPAGRREWGRFMMALNDKDFQAFKSLIPGLIPPKRGRRQQRVQAAGACAQPQGPLSCLARGHQ